MIRYARANDRQSTVGDSVNVDGNLLDRMVLNHTTVIFAAT